MRLFNLFVAFFIFSSSFIVCGNDSSNSQKEWYVGGNLHKANIKEWKNATGQNRIATASDMALSVPSIKIKVQQSGNIDTAKIYATELSECINKATEEQNTEHLKVSEIAAQCIVLMQW